MQVFRVFEQENAFVRHSHVARVQPIQIGKLLKTFQGFVSDGQISGRDDVVGRVSERIEMAALRGYASIDSEHVDREVRGSVLN